MNAGRSHLPRSLWVGIILALILALSSLPAVVSAKKGEPPPGHSKTEEATPEVSQEAQQTPEPDKPGEGPKETKEPRDHKGTPDPCITDPSQPGCGNGDHGKGNPVKANACKPWWSEVDPNCTPEPEKSQLPPPVSATRTPPAKASPTPELSPTPTPVVTKPPEHEIPGEKVRIQPAGPGLCPEVIIQDEPEGGNVTPTDLFSYGVYRLGGKVWAFGRKDILKSLPNGVYDSHPSHDPNSCQIVWQRDGDNPKLWLAGQDGSNPRSLKINGGRPSWGEYGIGFVFGRTHLYSLDPTLGIVSSLGADCTNPDVSPSGEWVGCTALNNTLKLVSARGSYYGSFETPWVCLNPSWAADGTGIFCHQPGEGVVFINSDGGIKPIYKNGIDVETDPLRGSAAVITEVIDGQAESWLIQDVFAISEQDSLEDVGQLLGHFGQNPTWWAPGFGVSYDPFMEQFLKGQ